MAAIPILFVFSLYCFVCEVSSAGIPTTEQSKVITVVRNAESYIKKNDIDKAIIGLKDRNDIFIANYDGVYFVSPLHPELIGKNVFNYKDSFGNLVVQEEINKAKTGGGWLKGRWRKNPVTGEFQCRKIYVLPLSGNYFIGSWYHYTSKKQGICLF